MTDASDIATAPKEINIRYEMVDGVLQISVSSAGLDDDANLIAMHLALALDRMQASASGE